MTKLPPGWYAEVLEFIDDAPYYKVVDSVGPASSEDLAIVVGKKIAEKHGGVGVSRSVIAHELFADGSRRVGDLSMAEIVTEIKKVGGAE